MQEQEFEVLSADFHRNGIFGEPFYVGIVREEGHRMLITAFPDEEDSFSDCRIAALQLDEAFLGNIHMHPADGQMGGNAWRGDQYVRQAEAIRDHAMARRP